MSAPEAEPTEEEKRGPSDLMFGITPRMIRRLCDPGMEGGFGYHPRQVARMTPDMIFFLLTDPKNLRSGKDHGNKSNALAVGAALADKDGLVSGRDEHGNPMKARIRGESYARRLRREAAERREAAAKEEAAKASKGQKEGRRAARRRRQAAKAAQRQGKKPDGD